jgi:hypothetical protein
MTRASFATAAAIAALAGAASTAAGCRSQTPPPTVTHVVVWKPLGTWAGHGDKQTETFTSDSGGFRVRWSAARETHPGAGRLRVVFRSGDSGREIIEAIDVQGAGAGTEDVAADKPRWYYLTIESADEDWTVAVDERIDAQRRP